MPRCLRPATPSQARAVQSLPEATALRALAMAVRSPPPRSSRVLSVAMAASLLVLTVAFLVGAGFTGLDGGAVAPMEVEGSEVGIQYLNLKICRGGYGLWPDP